MLLSQSCSITARENIQVLKIDNPVASAEISLFGGHILSFTPKHDGRERLWVSNNAIFDGNKAIRGGVPICWPWFGDHASDKSVASHGYVRTQLWTVVSSENTEQGTQIVIVPTTCQGLGFNGKAALSLEITIGKQLNIKLITTNQGDQAFNYTCALHTYFAVTDINQSQIEGLSGEYKDKTRSFDTFNTVNPYRFTEETDRVHLHQPDKLNILDAHNPIEILSSGHDSIVVWNPWQDKSISMGDMANDSYLTMLCVETAITQGQIIKAGETHVLEQVIG